MKRFIAFVLWKTVYGLTEWLMPIMNASLSSRISPSILKEAVILPVLKNKSLAPQDCKYYIPV